MPTITRRKATKKPAAKKYIAEPDMDTGTYYGDDENGVYINIARKGRTGGWYLTASVHTPHFVEVMFTDDGPYPTEAAAVMGGKNAAFQWLVDNDVFDDDLNPDH